MGTAFTTSRNLVTSASVTSDTSTTLSGTNNALPTGTPAHIRLIFDVTAFTDTAGAGAAAVDFLLEHSPDGGTTFYEHSRTASITTSTGTRELRFKNYHGPGDAAAEQTLAQISGPTADANDGLIMKDHRITASISGTGTTTLTYTVWGSVMEVHPWN